MTAALGFAAIAEPVKTDAGQVTGIPGKDASVRVYKGIPYAAPPTGQNRWKAPQPVAKWEGVKAADQFSPTCLAGGGGGGAGKGKGGGKGGGKGDAKAPAAKGPAPQAKGQAKGPAGPGASEDCLYINVWTTAASANERRPVFIWTYGGGFTGGSGSEGRYDGESLAKKGVVVVTYNYRLGMFGFLAHPELSKESGHNASGNYAMLDLISALKWVQKNIAAFGGDPNKVTLGGESAGAFQVAVMVASPEAKGLFQRGVAQSGGYMGLQIGKTRTLAQAEEAGLRAVGSRSIADLRAMSTQDLVQNLTGVQSGVVVDGWVLPEDPSVIYRAGKQNKVELLVGSNQDEGTFLAEDQATPSSSRIRRRRAMAIWLGTF